MSYRNIVLWKRGNFFLVFRFRIRTVLHGIWIRIRRPNWIRIRIRNTDLKKNLNQDQLKREKDPCRLVSFRGIVTNTKQEEAGIYTLDKKVLLFLGPLAFRKKKGKISLIDGSGTVLKKIKHKMYIFNKALFC